MQLSDLSELSAQLPIIGSDLSEPSRYLPHGDEVFPAVLTRCDASPVPGHAHHREKYAPEGTCEALLGQKRALIHRERTNDAACAQAIDTKH